MKPITVYFRKEIDDVSQEKLKQWLSCTNKSQKIEETIIKVANDEYIEKAIYQQEKDLLLEQIKEYRSMLNTLVESIANNNHSEQIPKHTTLSQSTPVPNIRNGEKAKEENDSLHIQNNTASKGLGNYSSIKGFKAKNISLADLEK